MVRRQTRAQKRNRRQQNNSRRNNRRQNKSLRRKRQSRRKLRGGSSSNQLYLSSHTQQRINQLVNEMKRRYLTPKNMIIALESKKFKNLNLPGNWTQEERNEASRILRDEYNIHDVFEEI